MVSQEPRLIWKKLAITNWGLKLKTTIKKILKNKEELYKVFPSMHQHYQYNSLWAMLSYVCIKHIFISQMFQRSKEHGTYKAVKFTIYLNKFQKNNVCMYV